MRGVCILTLILLVNAVEAEGASTIRSSVLAGGATGGAGSQHAVASTLGQTVAGRVSAVSHSLRSGFWIPRRSVTGTPAAAVPDRFAFYAPAPNPFSVEVSLRFDVPASGGRVLFRFYDVGGRIVRTLVDETATAGHKSVVWDGRDDRGNEIGPGLYFGAFEAPGYRRIQKVVRMP